jgi:hypothetical protein
MGEEIREEEEGFWGGIPRVEPSKHKRKRASRNGKAENCSNGSQSGPYSSSRSGSRSLLHDVDTHIRSGDTLAPDSLFPTPWACASRRQNILIRDYLEDINEIAAPRMF